MPEPRMEELEQDEWRKLLTDRHLGRLAIPDFGGPVIFRSTTCSTRTWSSSEPTPDPS
jgi:hypothetical protein